MTSKKTIANAQRTNIYMPKGVHRTLKVMAAQQDTTISWLVCEAVAKQYGMDQKLLHGLPKTRAERKEVKEQNPEDMDW